MEFIEVEKVNRNFEWSMHDLHSHSHYEFYYLTKGERTFFLKNGLYSISAPCFIAIPPHVLHKTEGGSYERYNVNFDLKYLNHYQLSVLNNLDLKIIIPSNENNLQLIEVLEQMSVIGKNDRFYDERLNALFSYLVFLLDSDTYKNSGQEIAPISDSDSVVMSIVEYINENFKEQITLDKLSNMYYTSKPKLIKDFKRVTNASPIDYLLKIRLNYSKFLLTTTKKPISEITYECGFSSPNYFCYIFKKKIHMSPSDFRQCYRQ